MVGQKLSHYQILEKIGQGGMGVVYRAMDEKLRRPVALKVLPPDLVDNEERRRRFLREARAAAAVTHPNIATVYGIDEADGIIFIAMELIEGQTLRSMLRGRALPVRDALRYAGEIAEGLSRAHQARVIHRDLKPENIIIDTDGHPKILDFGLAKLLEDRPDINTSQISQVDTYTQEMTREGKIMGTAAYMSPEQATGKTVDARSDIFSFGITLYEMVTGKVPFPGRSPIEKLSAIINNQPVPASRLNPEIPRDLDDLLGNCLEKEPADRYQDSGEIVVDLDQIRRGLDTKPIPMWLWVFRWTEYMIRKWATPSVWKTAGTVLLIGSFLGWFFWPPPPPSVGPSSDTVAVFPFTVRGGEAIADFGEGMVELLGTRLDGTGRLQSVEPHALLSFLQEEGGPPADPDAARRIAARFGAGQFVLGEILETGNRLNLNASLYDPAVGDEALAQANAQGTTGEFLELVNDLAGSLAAGRVTGPGERFARVALDTTGSYPALKAFLSGSSRFRSGEYDSAVEEFEESVAADPAFALGHYRTGVAAAFTLEPGALPAEAASVAVETYDRLAQREQQLFDSFRTLWKDGDASQAIADYRNIVSRFPEDVESWLHLGSALLHTGRRQGLWEVEAREALDRVLFYDPLQPAGLLQRHFLAGISGNHQESLAFAKKLVDAGIGGDYRLALQAVVAFSEEDPAARSDILEDLRRTDDTRLRFTLGNLVMTTGNLDAASEIAALFQESSRSPRLRAEGVIFLAHLDAARGNWAEAREKLAAAEQLDGARATVATALLSLHPDLELTEADSVSLIEKISQLDLGTSWTPVYRAYLTGRLQARQGDVPETLLNIDELEAIRAGLPTPEGEQPTPRNALIADLIHGLRTSVELIQGNDAAALAEIEKIEPQRNWKTVLPADLMQAEAFERFQRAEIHARLGQNAEALRWYGTIGRVGPHEIVLLAPAQQRMSEIK